ncbi:MAG: hypothetical protein ACXVCE_05615, partial [Bacteriovorax sp.]
MKHILFCTFMILFSACSSEGTYRKSSDTTNTLAKNPPVPWAEISSEGSDYALQNNKTRSIFLFNSACRKYEGSNLNALTSSILAGIEDLNIIEKKTTFYQEREALELIASGSLDGVLRFFKIITIQKNNCIYDYVLISTNQKN